MEIQKELQRVIELEGQTIRQLSQAISPVYEEAIQLLATCSGRVIVTGVGKSGLIAQKIAATLVSTGTPAVFLHAAEGMHGDIGIVTKDDIVLAVGKSGESEELLAILPFIRRLGARIIAITANQRSTMAKASDLVLLTPVEEEACPLNMAPTCSTTAALVLGDALAMTLMKLRNFQPTDFASYHPGGQLGKRLLLTVGDMMRSGEANAVISISSDVRSMLCEITSKRAGAVSVVDGENRLLGFVTDFDIRRVLEGGYDLFSLTIGQIMNDSPSSIYMDEKAIVALERMERREKPISVLPVLDRSDRVAGMIHLHDLVAKGL
ncbi:MAG: KpsF/GutQ family sugar-phosphate isomerase [Nitrospirales bacterium]|nr:KpsF/GutQ family sugar-phosphate isomerase [Nitrospira sp.]MDR4502075.1 KpsF/GutQ family sugar-phosphate isomerase [Nitrospirales bacterium]